MDKEQIELLWKKHYRPLVYAANQILHDVELSEDVAMECFLKVFENEQLHRDIRQMKNYLYQTVRNKCVDIVRANKRHGNTYEWLALYGDFAPPQLVTYEMEILFAVYEEIEKLSPGQKSIILDYIHGRTTGEIHSARGGSAQTILNLKNKAFIKLKKAIVPRFQHLYFD